MIRRAEVYVSLRVPLQVFIDRFVRKLNKVALLGCAVLSKYVGTVILKHTHCVLLGSSTAFLKSLHRFKGFLCESRTRNGSTTLENHYEDLPHNVIQKRYFVLLTIGHCQFVVHDRFGHQNECFTARSRECETLWVPGFTSTVPTLRLEGIGSANLTKLRMFLI